MDTPLVRVATTRDAAAIARVHVESWRTTYRGIVPQPFLDALSVDARARFWTGQLTNPPPGYEIYVAEVPGAGVVGFADGGAERSGDPDHTGELFAIYLLAPHQGRGLGGRLFRAVTDHLTTAGHRGMRLWVLADNPACRFYEALGGRPIARQTIALGGAELAEVAYGFGLNGEA